MPNTYWSKSTGIIVKLDSPRVEDEISVISNGGHELSSRPHHALSYVGDWQDVSEVDSKFISDAAKISRSHRVIAYLRILLLGLPVEVERQAVDVLEKTIAEGIDNDLVLAEILVAPLIDSDIAGALSKFSAAQGCGATAELLAKIYEAQPHLRRLVAFWQAIPKEKFLGISLTRKELWNELVSSKAIVGILDATSLLEFNKSWIPFVHFAAVADRRIATDLMSHLGESLFPLSITPAVPPISKSKREAPSNLHRDDEKRVVNRFELNPRSEAESKRESKERALKQVNAIAKVVAGGRDDLGDKWLGALIASQTTEETNPEYVSKSLCNLASRCADMYRYDFERKCLLKGMEINPTDIWTRIQWGNHLKRLGQFDSANQVFEQIVGKGHDVVVFACMADILVQRGEYDKALVAYKKINGWENELSILVSIANIYRKTGDTAAALTGFEEISTRWKYHRAIAGFAEIKKQGLEFEAALEIYDRVLADDSVDFQSHIIYRAAKANIYKAMGNLPEAHDQFDRLVRDYPFFMQARVQKAAVLGLLGEAQRGLNGIPASVGPKGFGDWLKLYIRGLLLLKLKRYEDAQNELVDNAGKALEVGDERRMLRLGAAVAFLNQSKVKLASERLEKISGGNLFVNYIEQTLRMHVAVAEADRATIAMIEKKFAVTAMTPKSIVLVRDSLKKGDMVRAAESEVGLLLQAV